MESIEIGDIYCLNVFNESIYRKRQSLLIYVFNQCTITFITIPISPIVWGIIIDDTAFMTLHQVTLITFYDTNIIFIIVFKF